MLQLDEKIIEQMKREYKNLDKLISKNQTLERKVKDELKRIEKKAIQIANDVAIKAGATTDTMRQTAYKIALKREGYGEKRFSRVMHRVTVFTTKAEEAMNKMKDQDRFLRWLDEELKKHMVFEKEFKEAPAKTYLSKIERQDIMTYVALGGKMQQFIEENKNITEKERLYLEEASKAITLFYEQVIKRVGKDEIDRMSREANQYELALISTTKYKQAKKEQEQKSLTWEFESDDERDDIIEGLIETFCRGCNKNPIRDCGIRKMFMKHDIEPMNYFAGPGECQYKYPDKN